MTQSTVLLTTAEAATLLSLTPRYLSENYRRLGLPVVRVGHRTLRFRREDVERWARKHARP